MWYVYICVYVCDMSVYMCMNMPMCCISCICMYSMCGLCRFVAFVFLYTCSVHGVLCMFGDVYIYVVCVYMCNVTGVC